MQRLLIAIILLLVATITASSQKPTNHIRVSLEVTAESVIQGQLKSSINNGLRSLNNVVVTNVDDSRFQISVVVIPINAAGRQTGYAASIVVLGRGISKDTIYQMIESCSSEVKDVLKSTCVNSSLSDQALLIGNTDIEQLSKRIVAEIDAGTLEEFRQLLQRFEDGQKKP